MAFEGWDVRRLLDEQDRLLGQLSLVNTALRRLTSLTGSPDPQTPAKRRRIATPETPPLLNALRPPGINVKEVVFPEEAEELHGTSLRLAGWLHKVGGGFPVPSREVQIVCDPKGIEVRSPTGDGREVLSWRLPASDFSSYRCPRRVTHLTTAGFLQEVLPYVAPTEELCIWWSRADGPEFMRLASRAWRGGLTLLGQRSIPLELPQFQEHCCASATVPTAELERVLQVLRGRAKTVQVRASPEAIVFIPEGYSGETIASLRRPLNVQRPMAASFHLQHLVDLLDAASPFDLVRLSVGDTYFMARCKGESGVLQIYVAALID
mmetsp:Transcript_20005/g.43644  ORF Transcript_20005/g.43644 Transcript_20005/m.43644 type:complete len:322 (-) Transcript_20005:70-1035(-)